MKTRVKCTNILQGMFLLKYALLIFLLLAVTTNFAQNLTDVARSGELTWYGVDCSQARFIGFENHELNNFSINDWGYANLSNNKLGMIRRAYGKKILYDVSMIAKKRNDTLNYKSLIINYTYEIDIDKIKKVVAEYKIKGEGFGVLFIVESFEKIHNSIFIWVVYIDNSTGKVISSRRYIGGGYGGSGDNNSEGGIKLVIKLSGKDLRLYK